MSKKPARPPRTSPGQQQRFAAGRDLARDPWQERHRIREIAGQLVIGIIVLSVTVAIAPGISVSDWLGIPIAVVLTTIFGALLRPLLIWVAIPFGWFGAGLLAVFGNAIVMYPALVLAPGIEVHNFAEVLAATWIYAFILAFAQWLLVADSDQVFLASAVRQTTRAGIWGSRLTPGDHAAIEGGGHPVTGVVFVQLDGLPAPVLEWGVMSGNFPTLSRWIRSGEYVWTEWTARVPSTTPVSQAGILHGNSANMPAFRWYEKDSGKLLVANHPPDAAIIEARISDGRGLLADGGVSISNLFSGDAAERLLTMSGMSKLRAGLGPSRSYSSFFTQPSGFSRAFALTVGEMIKEKWQARAQIKRDIEPRVKRKGAYVALRGITNVLLRDLNSALVIEAMMKGAKSVYVDYVDYDEIAHHAGVVRPEALRALEGLDRVLYNLELVVRYAPRPYRFVCVSDHGQSQGATFKQRYGQPLEEVVRDLMGSATQMVAATGTVEDWGPLNTFLSQLQTQSSVTGGLARRAMRNRTEDGAVELGPGAQERDAVRGAAAAQRPELVVVGSGNLGGVWFAREPGRLTLEEIEDRWPGLVQGLAVHPGIGFVVVETRRDGPVALGRNGLQRLLTAEVEGDDPLSPFGPDARNDLLRVARFTNAPDIYLNSLYDPVTDEVAAFEELVGCHGGLGGWQTRAILVHPAYWPVAAELRTADGRLVGAEAVHRQLVRWLELLGHRGDLEPRTSGPGGCDSGPTGHTGSSDTEGAVR